MRPFVFESLEFCVNRFNHGVYSIYAGMELIRVRIIAAKHILFSLHPLFSRWWCSGAILKIRLPVSLKLNTCRMTERPSTIYTLLTDRVTSGFDSIKQEDTNSAPKNREPVSPIKIFAGLMLKNKKFNKSCKL